MALKKKPVNGMKDILPSEMAVRMYVTELIRRTYAEFGFSSIEIAFPLLSNSTIPNLSGSST